MGEPETSRGCLLSSHLPSPGGAQFPTELLTQPPESGVLEDYRDTSIIRNSPPLGLHGRPIPRALWLPCALSPRARASVSVHPAWSMVTITELPFLSMRGDTRECAGEPR